MDNNIIQKILFEIDQIDELINESQTLLEICKTKEPDFVEKCGIAMILQSFYNGIENIISLIIKNKDLTFPNENKWHKELLDKAFKETKNRTEIFNNELKVSLNEYLKFRHFARHSYGFQFKWEKMRNMLFNMNIIWEEVKRQVNIFIKNN